MNVAAMDPYASPAVAASANVTLVSSLEELLPIADFLTIHTPMIASTRGMISSHELNMMKPGARILNVARGGIIDEVALLAALSSNRLGGAAIDVFTTEPPNKVPDSAAALLIEHPRVVATPHLGASTVEAQENVSIDVCEQVLQILAGDLPRSAVNAPLILPAEYKTLQPYVRLVEKMGALYTQHFTSSKSQGRNRNTFDLIYEGEIASINNTKPLFAAFIKGPYLSDLRPFDSKHQYCKRRVCRKGKRHCRQRAEISRTIREDLLLICDSHRTSTISSSIVLPNYIINNCWLPKSRAYLKYVRTNRPNWAATTYYFWLLLRSTTIHQ